MGCCISHITSKKSQSHRLFAFSMKYFYSQYWLLDTDAKPTKEVFAHRFHFHLPVNMCIENQVETTEIWKNNENSETNISWLRRKICRIKKEEIQ